MCIEVKSMDSIPAGDNPFWHDHYNMGTRIGANVMVMHPNHGGDQCPYMIIVNTDTGERVRVVFEKWPAHELCERIMNGRCNGR